MYKGLIFSDSAGRKCIHGTDPTHPYVVKFVNANGVVGVKSPDEFGGEETSRIRVITWDVLTGEKTGDDYQFLLDCGWEQKPNNTHVSVRLGNSDTCECCGQSLLDDANFDSDEELDDRLQEAIDFLED